MKIKKGGKLGGQERNMDKTLLQCRWDRVSIRERRRRTVRGGEEDRQTRSSQIGYFTVVVAFHLLNINIYKKLVDNIYKNKYNGGGKGRGMMFWLKV